MALTRRQKPTTVETPAERVARLRAEHGALPILEAEALNAGDEETLARLDARRRVVRHELDLALADVRQAELDAARAPLTAELADMNADIATTAARLEELTFAVEVYRLRAEEDSARLAQLRRKVLRTLDRLADLDAEALRTETTVLRRTLEDRNAA